jgi:hypothetical protein
MVAFLRSGETHKRKQTKPFTMYDNQQLPRDSFATLTKLCWRMLFVTVVENIFYDLLFMAWRTAMDVWNFAMEVGSKVSCCTLAIEDCL